MSSYMAPGIGSQPLKITYTAYNQTAETLTGVVLTTTLQGGVSFLDASVLPDRKGQELAWSIGTLSPFDRVSVVLTVGRDAGLNPLVLDTGAAVFATLDARAVSDAAPAATLRDAVIAPELLGSTPDANTTDPFIQQRAAELDYAPARIFSYLNSDVGYESYTGSLRGARGTLWSAAGNALDEASLGVALFRASGIPARYARGTLSDTLARQLILSMFPPSFQTVGRIPIGTAAADPANDPKLLAETRDHYWIQFDAGAGFQNADTSGLAGSGIGTAVTTATSTFAEVAEALRHKVRVKLDAEIYSQIGAAFGLGNGLGTRSALDHTFNTVDLVGRPITIGNFVNTTAIGTPIFVSRTITYSPYIIVGDEAFDSDNDDLIRGQDYQEVLTNFPLATQLVTGLFLKMEVSGPDGPTQTFERALVDRIGFAARRGIGGSNVSFDPKGPPALSEFDLFTLHVQPALQDASTLLRLHREAAAIAQRLQDLVNAAPDSPQAAPLLRRLLVVNARALGIGFLAQSDSMTRYLQESSLVKGYHDRPRIIITSSRLETPGGEQSSDFTMSIDLRSNPIRALPFPGQDADAVVPFNTVRGFSDSIIESELFLVPGGTTPQTTISADRVFQAAAAQGIELVRIGASNLMALDTLPLSPEAKARITAAIGDGLDVIVPSREVAIDGASAIAWYQLNPATGELVGVTESGDHGVIGSFVTGLVSFALTAAALAVGVPAVIGIVMG